MAESTLKRKLMKSKKLLLEWRRGGRSPRRIPDQVWERAVAVASEYGVGPVARELGLDHAKLKSKLEQRPSGQDLVAPQASQALPATFVELLHGAAGSNSLEPCIFRIESRAGSRMSVEVGGLDAGGLATVLCRFGGQ